MKFQCVIAQLTKQQLTNNEELTSLLCSGSIHSIVEVPGEVKKFLARGRILINNKENQTYLGSFFFSEFTIPVTIPNLIRVFETGRKLKLNPEFTIAANKDMQQHKQKIKDKKSEVLLTTTPLMLNLKPVERAL